MKIQIIKNLNQKELWIAIGSYTLIISKGFLSLGTKSRTYYKSLS